MKKKTVGAIEGTRTPTPLRVHGPEPCASANSATMAKSDSLRGDPCGAPFRREPQIIFYRGVARCQTFEQQAAGFRYLSSNAALTPGAPNARSLLPNFLSFQFGVHRDVRLEYLGHGTTALGILRRLLESSLISIWDPADHIQV